MSNAATACEEVSLIARAMASVDPETASAAYRLIGLGVDELEQAEKRGIRVSTDLVLGEALISALEAEGIRP